MIDEICQRLQLCYRCIRYDRNNTCEPWETDYLVEMTHSLDDANGLDSYASMCGVNDPSSCSYEVCTCEMRMLTEFWNKVTLTSYVVDYSVKQENGFDYDENCARGSGQGDKACCGPYPYRKPFAKNPDRLCCENISTYNPTMKICCEDGSVVDYGNLC